jgi:hypothetical protein
MSNYKITARSYLIIFITLAFSVVTRIYNINYDHLWFDEIVSFWVAEPQISIKESFARHWSTEAGPFLYNFLLKIYFKLFGYDINLGRYLSFAFNMLGVLITACICFKIKKNNAFILCLILLASNIFLIIYSQELRGYSLMFFLSALYLYLFLQIIIKEANTKKRLILLNLFTLVQILMILSHPFCLIIFFSSILFSIIKFFKFNENLKELNYSIIITLILYFFYFLSYYNNTNIYPSWIVQPDLKFYTNFYFSKFFGSRLIGLLHLIILLGLIINFLKKKKEKIFNINLFVIILFLSYFLPLTFGYVFRPIMFPRYIIFVLIPITIILSILIYEIKNKYLKNLLILILIFGNIGNLYTESVIQQFIGERPRYKSNFSEALNAIDKSKMKYYTIDIPSYNTNHEIAISHYTKIIANDLKLKVNFITKEDFFNSDINEIWTLCLIVITKDKCSKVDKIFDTNYFENKDFTNISLKRVSKL